MRNDSSSPEFRFITNPESFKRLAQAAFNKAELEFLLQDPAFRLMYDAPIEPTEMVPTFEKLCLLGHRLLDEDRAKTGKTFRG